MGGPHPVDTNQNHPNVHPSFIICPHAPMASRHPRSGVFRPPTLRSLLTFHAPTSVHREMEGAIVIAIDSELRDLQFG